MSRTSRGILWAWLATATACNSAFEPGEFFSVLPTEVLTFEYETSAFRFSAHRFDGYEPFRAVVEEAGIDRLVHCPGTARFERSLADFESLRIRRRITENQLAVMAKSKTYDRLRIATEPPMEAYELVLIPLSTGLHAVETNGFIYELDLTRRSVEALRRSCAQAP